MANQSLIYLDHAAATPMDQAVLKAMTPFFSQAFYNPSATYLPALEVRKALGAARASVAYWLGARPSEIIFTAGGTEANNLAIHGVMRQFPKGNVVTSAIEHESVLKPAGNYDHREVKVNPDGRLDLVDLARQIDEQTVLVSIIYANNEIGTIQPLAQVAEVVEKALKQRQSTLPLYFHTDACQAANYLDLHTSRLKVNMLSINGGKVYGPKQSGALYVKSDTRLLPLIEGGGQERNLRSGTENVAAAIGLAKALNLVQADRLAETKRLQALQSEFISRLKAELPRLVINGSLKWRLPNNLHFTWPGRDNERLLLQLEAAGILGAAGSACNASNEEPSHVLKALGLTTEEIRASVRLTMGRGTTAPMIERLLATLKQL